MDLLSYKDFLLEIWRKFESTSNDVAGRAKTI